MPTCDLLIRNASVIDGTGTAAVQADVAVDAGVICATGTCFGFEARTVVEAEGHTLTPGFIDVHTHDDTSVIRAPQMLPKLSQGITTVIVGNCGISAAPVQLLGEPPDPLNLLGDADAFCYPTFAAYVAAVNQARPAVNVAALVGHTSLRSNHMDRLDRPATSVEVSAMRLQLEEALSNGAIGLSTGLAYLAAHAAPAEEVEQLAELLAAAGGIYTTHLRTEAEGVLEALQEAFQLGRRCHVPVIVSHLKCAGMANWGRSGELLQALDDARTQQPAGWDCYPYAAGSSTLDLRQVDPRIQIAITWSKPYPELAGKTLAQIAETWAISQADAARRLQPAGAIYHSISEQDMQTILSHPATMIGSDGLPNDLKPHPRLWGTFPRVLGRYSRELKLFSLVEAVHRMTGLPAQRFRLAGRGVIREGYVADLVLFNAGTIRDTATFNDPASPSEGILGVWVNGVLSYQERHATGWRAGRFLPLEKTLRQWRSPSAF